MAAKPNLRERFARWRAGPALNYLPAPARESLEAAIQEKAWSSTPRVEDPSPEDAAPPEQPETIREQLQELEDFAVSMLENAVLRGRAHPVGTGMLTGEERDRMLAPFRDPLFSDRQRIREVLRQAFIRGIERVHRELHGQPGIDNEVLDQAIEFHSHPREDGPEVKA